MTDRLLLCCDMDRTLIPNGLQTESPLALPLFRHFVRHSGICLCYVTGRSRILVERAITKWNLPQPDSVAVNVGSAIFSLDSLGNWHEWPDWQDEIARDWKGITPDDLLLHLHDIAALTPQAPDRQGRFKLCFTAPPDTDSTTLFATITDRLSPLGIAFELVWSIDETVPIGLLDILPRRASKLGAIDYIRTRKGFTREETVFAGDSGNDLHALSSPIPAVLVANATDAVRAEAIRQAQEAQTLPSLYLARGGLLGMNGTYASGILEGILHFHPDLTTWLTSLAADLETAP